MKLILEDINIADPEITIRGDISSEEVVNIISRIKAPTAIKRLEVTDDGESFFINSEEIIYAMSSDDVLEIYTEGRTYSSRMRLYELKEKLCSTSSPFVQISKNTIVNVDFVKSIQAEFSGNYVAFLKSRSDKLIISRRYFKEFKEKI